ncbi:MAG: TIGR02281 family clan AA aspartic protease [Gammaproteobacteria bacterium]
MSDQENNFSANAGRWMIVLSWVAAIGLLTLLFTNVLDNKRNPNQNLNTHLLDDGSKEVVLQSSTHGHYVASGKINHKPVVFLVDTGASFVSVPEQVANRVGLKKGSPITATTANGNITVYSTVLDRISLGEITLYNVRADINPHMDGEEILLGMSFLRNLSVAHEGGKLTIRQ